MFLLLLRASSKVWKPIDNCFLTTEILERCRCVLNFFGRNDFGRNFLSPTLQLNVLRGCYKIVTATLSEVHSGNESNQNRTLFDSKTVSSTSSVVASSVGIISEFKTVCLEAFTVIRDEPGTALWEFSIINMVVSHLDKRGALCLMKLLSLTD